ncbi:ADP compounds hydrolase NudE, partial [Xanthomonas perforans]
MSSRLPIIHKITDLGDGPFRRQQLDLEFSNGQRR